MPFQFLCPEGHLLQGDESQVGQQCKCPHCGLEFVVPSPGGRPADPQAPPSMPGPEAPPVAEAEEEGFPGIRIGSGVDVPVDIARQMGAPDTSGDILHILCPAGHVLETPREMLGQDAMCPFCQTQFRLRMEDSREYQRERAERRELREQRMGRNWLNWAIAAAVVVVLGVILMMVVMSMT